MLPHEFVVPSAQYNNVPVITVAGGGTIGVKIPALYRGTVRKLRVVQLTGTLDGFSYTLYNTAAACQTDGTFIAPIVSAAQAQLYQITPLLVVAATKSSYTSGLGYPEDGVSNLDMPYEVQDNSSGGVLNGTSSGRIPAVWLKIIDGGSTGTKTYGVALTVMDPLL